MSNTSICAHTAHSNGIPHRRQYVELVEPFGCSEEGESVEAINRHTSNPTSDDDTKWYAADERRTGVVTVIFHRPDFPAART